MVSTSNVLFALGGAAAWAAWSTVCGYVAHRLPARVLDWDRGLLRLRHPERGGHDYERVLRIKRWKDALPEAGSLFRGGYSKRTVTRSQLDRYVVETRRAELAHWAILALVPVFVLAVSVLGMPWWLALAMAGYGVVANVPCILVQRYNRARLSRVLAASVSSPR